MDLNQQQDPNAQEASLFYPVPHSHWFPRPLAFRSYRPSRGRSELGTGQRGAIKPHSQISRSLSVKLTKDIVNTYRVCNPRFQFSENHNPKRFLTIPSAGVFNSGSDNENHDLILYFGRILVNEDKKHRYVVKDIVGCGTFGQVAKCLVPETNEYVAVKVIKNQSAYSTQAKVEIGILHRLNNIRDWRNENHVVRSFDHFTYEGHLCIVFELLGVNLFELLKTNNFKGISLQLVRIFTGQLLGALSLLYDARVIHCDLKPENILLSSLRAAEIKLIDFGSACMEEHTVYSYIQSRFYRSPEVVLGHSYSTAIDMWSLGCVAAELFLGLPLFPGQCPYDLLLFIVEKLGKQPPDHILQNAKNTNKYFKVISAAPQPENGYISGQKSVYQFLTPEENEAREKKKPVIGKRYMRGSLEDMIMSYPMKSSVREDMDKERFSRKVFIDFLKGLIEVDPHKRWTPHEASQHPFVTEEPFTGPFRPRKERLSSAPSGLGLMMEHPTWFGQGLSPHVGNMSLTSQLNGSQQLQPLPLPFSGSPASFGSFGDNGTLGSSLGSIGDGAGSSMSMPPRLNGHTSFGRGSPDTRRHHLQRMQNAGHTQLGISPSGSGVCSFSLGASPSHQFHVSGPHFMPSSASQQVSSPGSQYMASSGILYQGSPGSTFQSSPGSSFRGPESPSQSSPRYDPTSPAYAAKELSVRRNPGVVPVPSHSNGTGAVPYENVLLARLQQHNAAGNTDGISGNFGSMEGSLQLKTLRVCGNTGMLDQHQLNITCPPGALGSQLFTSETTTEAGDEEFAGFGDCDGDYREEFLFEHDPVHESSVFPMPSEIGPPDGVMGCGGARLGPGPGYGPNGLSSRSTKAPLKGSHAGYGRGQTLKQSSASSSRLSHKNHKQPHAHNQQQTHSHSPQHSLTSGSNSGNSSGPPSRRFSSGEPTSHVSPAGVLHFQQRQQQHPPHHFPDHQHHFGSSAPLHHSGDMEKQKGDGLLPPPQIGPRGIHVAGVNSGQFVGMGGHPGAWGNPDGHGLPMLAGLGQSHGFGVDMTAFPAQPPAFPPSQIYATGQFFVARRAGPALVGLHRPPPTGRGSYRKPGRCLELRLWRNSPLSFQISETLRLFDCIVEVYFCEASPVAKILVSWYSNRRTTELDSE